MAFAIFFFIFSTIVKLSLCQDGLRISPFTKDVICDVVDRVSKGCSRDVGHRHGIVSCVAVCVLDNSCIGASLDDNGNCFLHQYCPGVSVCSVIDTTHRYMVPYCVHGSWNQTTRSCDCVEFTFGARCNEYVKDCKGLITPDHVFGEHTTLIDPDQDGKNPVRVVCRTRPPSHSAILIMRNEGRINFNRSWNEYKAGFYVDFDNLWAGLDGWSQLSASGCNDLFSTLTFDWKPITRVIRTYSDFVLGGESTGYSYSFSSSETSTKGTPPAGTYFGDCLGPLQNTPMSTWDRDQDGDPTSNCAARAGSGWWYSGCDTSCNLLGYGYDHWFSKPSPELLSVEGVDMDAHASTVAYLTMFLRCS